MKGRKKKKNHKRKQTALRMNETCRGVSSLLIKPGLHSNERKRGEKKALRIGLLGQMGHFRHFLPFFLHWSQKESAFPTAFGLFQTPGGSGPSFLISDSIGIRMSIEQCVIQEGL